MAETRAVADFRHEFRQFLEEHVKPHQVDWWRNGCVSREVWTQAAAAGFLGVTVDPQWGGRGLGFEAAVAMSEELSRAHEMGFGILLHSEVVLPYLEELGTPDQKERYLRDGVSGKCITAFAMTEPAGGSDVASISTNATKVDGGSCWLLNGEKTFIANGQLCDTALVLAVTDPKASRAEWGLSLFLVDSGTPGFHRLENLPTIAMYGQDTSRFSFDDVKLPASALLGKEGRGFQYVMERLVRERLVVAAGAQARAEAILQQTIARTKERFVFGQPVFDHQANAFTLADCKADVEVGRAYIRAAVESYIAGDDATVSSAIAKCWHTEMLESVAGRCVQLWGAEGTLLHNPVARASADARMQKIYAGTNEVMRMIIARSLRGGSRSPRSRE